MRQLIFSPSNDPAFNLAAEASLFSAKEGNFVFLYINKPCVIIGSNQIAENEVDMDFCADNHIPVLHRLSGGGAVYHDEGNLNYCFIHEKTANPLSAGFLNPIMSVLTALDIPAETGKRKDLWLDGGKISGTASHVSKNRELHHGTLLYDTDLMKLHRALNPAGRDLMRKATASVPSPVKNIRPFLKQRNGVAPDRPEFFCDFILHLLNYYELDALTPLNALLIF